MANQALADSARLSAALANAVCQPVEDAARLAKEAYKTEAPIVLGSYAAAATDAALRYDVAVPDAVVISSELLPRIASAGASSRIAYSSAGLKWEQRQSALVPGFWCSSVAFPLVRLRGSGTTMSPAAPQVSDIVYITYSSHHIHLSDITATAESADAIITIGEGTEAAPAPRVYTNAATYGLTNELINALRLTRKPVAGSFIMFHCRDRTEIVGESFTLALQLAFMGAPFMVATGSYAVEAPSDYVLARPDVKAGAAALIGRPLFALGQQLGPVADQPYVTPADDFSAGRVTFRPNVSERSIIAARDPTTLAVIACSFGDPTLVPSLMVSIFEARRAIAPAGSVLPYRATDAVKGLIAQSDLAIANLAPLLDSSQLATLIAKMRQAQPTSDQVAQAANMLTTANQFVTNQAKAYVAGAEAALAAAMSSGVADPARTDGMATALEDVKRAIKVMSLRGYEAAKAAFEAARATPVRGTRRGRDVGFGGSDTAGFGALD